MALLAADLARGQDSESQTFVDETSVIEVEVPVQVISSGQPVRGLTRENFALYDEGELQEIVGFEVLDLSQRSQTRDEGEAVTFSAAPEQVPSAARRRNLLFLIDFAYPDSWDRFYGAGSITTLQGMSKASQRMTTILESLHPSDQLAIGYMSPLRGIKLLQGWTSNREQFRRGLEILRAAIKIEPERVREIWAELEPGRAATLPSGEEESPWATMEDLVAEAKTSSLRGDATLPHTEVVEAFIDGLIAARRQLGEPPGTRHVVYLSAGFPIPSLFDLQRLFREFRTKHWAIQTINTAGLGFGADSLFLLAYETGGQLFTNHNHVDVLLADMAEETAVTYVLSFQAKGGQKKGSFHKLRVKLVDWPTRARLVHRRAYYSPGAEDDEEGLAAADASIE